MKRFWLTLFVVVIICVCVVYVFIPNPIIVSKSSFTYLKPTVVTRYLHDDSKWVQWFPSEKSTIQQFIYNNIEYKPGGETYSSKEVTIIDDDNKYLSVIHIIPIGLDSCGIEWQFQTNASNNPVKRIIQYQNAKKVWKQMDTLLTRFESAANNTKNVYGYKIDYTTLTDTTLVSTTISTKQYPTTGIIYNMIDKLRAYIQSQKVSEHNYPMLNITHLQNDTYQVKVGIPTSIPLKGNDEIEPKRMMMLTNKTLVANIVGDTSAINSTMRAVKHFMEDHQYQSPVIPFQQLVTDRRQQPDSTKWITKIFAPYN